MKVKLLGNLFETVIIISGVVSCAENGSRTIETNGVDFSPVEDPVCEVVQSLCSDFDMKESSLFTDSFSDCNVTITLEKNRYMATDVNVFDGSMIFQYERSLSKVDEETYQATFKVERRTFEFSKTVAEFSGTLHTNDFKDFNEEEFAKQTSKINWKEIEYDDVIDTYSFDEVIVGELSFFDKEEDTGDKIKRHSIEINDSYVTISDYWPNGQTKIFKVYKQGEKGIIAAGIFNEDGSRGNPVASLSLRDDRWVGFTSNIYNRFYGNLYLVLRARKDDWHTGKAITCYSESGCRKDYTIYEQGVYEITDSRHIRLHMKTDRGYSNTYILSVAGAGEEDPYLSGDYGNIFARFETDLEMGYWFKHSLTSKCRMY